MSFRSQVANSAVWVGISTVVVKVLSFITITLVLAASWIRRTLAWWGLPGWQSMRWSFCVNWDWLQL